MLPQVVMADIVMVYVVMAYVTSYGIQGSLDPGGKMCFPKWNHISHMVSKARARARNSGVGCL